MEVEVFTCIKLPMSCIMNNGFAGHQSMARSQVNIGTWAHCTTHQLIFEGQIRPLQSLMVFNMNYFTQSIEDQSSSGCNFVPWSLGSNSVCKGVQWINQKCCEDVLWCEVPTVNNCFWNLSKKSLLCIAKFRRLGPVMLVILLTHHLS